MVLIHSSQILSLSLSLSLSLCARVLLGVLSSDSQEGGQRETKKRKQKRFPFLGVCVYSADSLLSAAAVTTRLFVTAVLELGAKLILQKPITI
jgi:hypothetical protein